MGFEFLATRRDGPVEYLTLNRPDVRNALSDVVLAELTAWATSIRSAPDVRVAVLAGAGRHFCAGADVAWMRRMGAATQEENRRDAHQLSATFRALDTLPVPLIGRVHGGAIGGGTGLAAVCDIVVASRDAQFGFTEVRLGILPAAISPFALAKIGPAAARELFLTGARFSAERALAIGLVHRVEAEEHLDAAIAGYIKDILAGAPSAIALAKALIREVAWKPAADVADLTSDRIAQQRVSADGREGLSAFLEKRTAAWVPSEAASKD